VTIVIIQVGISSNEGTPPAPDAAARGKDPDVLLWLSLASFLFWLFHSYAVRSFLNEVWRLFKKFVS